MEDSEGQPLPFLSKIVSFPDNKTSYELLKPITNFKSCHDGTPSEARVLFTCRKCPSSSSQHGSPEAPESDGNREDEFVVKIKVQIPSPEHANPFPGPSDTTTHELKALTNFSRTKSTYAPHLVAFMTTTQSHTGKLPGGYITYTVMTQLPGSTLFTLGYWNLDVDERSAIARGFLIALRNVYVAGVEPVDRGLRNVLWDAEERRCTIIDFELWNETSTTFSDEKRELQRWGLERRPPPKDWWAEWSLHMR